MTTFADTRLETIAQHTAEVATGVVPCDDFHEPWQRQLQAEYETGRDELGSHLFSEPKPINLVLGGLALGLACREEVEKQTGERTGIAGNSYPATYTLEHWAADSGTAVRVYATALQEKRLGPKLREMLTTYYQEAGTVKPSKKQRERFESILAVISPSTLRLDIFDYPNGTEYFDDNFFKDRRRSYGHDSSRISPQTSLAAGRLDIALIDPEQLAHEAESVVRSNLATAAAEEILNPPVTLRIRAQKALSRIGLIEEDQPLDRSSWQYRQALYSEELKLRGQVTPSDAAIETARQRLLHQKLEVTNTNVRTIWNALSIMNYGRLIVPSKPQHDFPVHKPARVAA
jgi:hypothetical protein